MILFLLLFLVVIITVILLVASGGNLEKCIAEYASPLNLAIYREPKTLYSDQVINLWIDKPWRDDGNRIPCCIERSSAISAMKTSDKTLVIYSHGNGENILNCVPFIRELSTSIEADVLCYDYSGYGLNPLVSTERTPEGVNLTLRTIYEHMVYDEGYLPENIIFWGYSLGSGPSVYMASYLSQKNTSVKGVVLFGAYTSILDVVSDSTYPEIADLFSERWNNVKIIHHVTCPILILHGQNDAVINVKHAQRLKQASKTGKLVILPNIGHASFSWNDSIKEVKEWLKFVNR
jgi:pimeloyl-ACP methyl ester carboxylesterase